MNTTTPLTADVVLHLPRATNRHPILQNLPPLEILADQNETTSSRLASSPNTHNSTTMQQENPSRRRETEDILLRELERAASQGLLSAVLPDIPDQRPPQPVDVIPASPQQNEPDIGDMQITGHFNIEADTSIDRDMITSALGVATGNTGSSCRLGTLLDIRTWGDPDNPAAAITENRAELLDGRDQIDPASIISLAQAYLYASFGAEASQILTLSVNDSPQTRALRQIADLSDGSNVRTNGPLSELQNCPNTGAFWALLTENAIPAQGVNHDAVIEVVTSLPPHLRSIFGSRIMRLYISAGDTSRAQIIRDAIARTSQDAQPGFRIAQAEMSQSAGEHEAAEIALADVIGENSLQSLDALVIFLQTALEQKKSIEPTILENAEALAFEHRNNETGVRLSFLLARTYSQARDFERAANAFETLDGIASAHDLRFAWREFSQEIYNLEADADFVTKVYQHKNNLQSNSLDTHLQHKIAGRLIDLGFSDAGQGFLETPSLNHTADVRLLLAQAAYLVEDYDRALQLAAQLEAPQASELRQGIHQRLRKYGTALQELETRDSSASTLDLTWRGGDWDALASDDLDLPQTKAAQIMIDIGQTSDIDAASPSLSTSAEALQRSQSDRAVLDELLNDVFPSMETVSPDVSG
ncbi:tetratricopeptide repeat protein [Halocynthiibacter namhaensis]|uniref:tetratricopeptide repeat protein n=1 Tax=Halocynthiibacter namhaensis TaxID=1290553 RepID=UPI00057959C5|nr:hypothetical protein [Halocynthiibacter namhaensis]